MDSAALEHREALYRAAVGSEKADYYAPRFMRFDQPDASTRSWHWPAFFASFFWFLYRRMYRNWAIYCLLVPFLLALGSGIVTSILGRSLGDATYYISGVGYSFVLLPMYANSLYHQAIKRRIAELERRVPEFPSQILVLENTPHTTHAVWVILPVVGFALLGVVTAIAIPAYEAYVIRAQVAEGLTLAEHLKSAVVQSYVARNQWPESLDGLQLVQPLSGKFVARLSVDHGTITIGYGNGAAPAISGHLLSLRPSVSSSGAVLWTCGYAQAMGVDPPTTAAAAGTTDIKPQLLPADCRAR
jgi:Tfp pilus assembly major pilin PilA